jgi:tetratricopeptide (TPR) repeat protein
MVVNTCLRILLVLVAVASLSGFAQEDGVEWSWETPEDFFADVPRKGDKAKAGAAVAVESPGADKAAETEPVVEDEDFNWAWEEGTVEGAVEAAAEAGAAPKPAPAAPPASGPPIKISAYDEVLKENLDLRKEADAAAQEADRLHKENIRLNKSVQDLESRVREFAAVIQDLKKDKKGDATTEVADLSAQLIAAREENSRIKEEMAQLKEALASRPPASDTPGTTGKAPAPQPGSDLLRQLEENNARLKQRIAELETARREAAEDSLKMAGVSSQHAAEMRKVREAQGDLKARLAQSEASERKHRRTVERMLKEIPRLEKEIEKLRSQLKRKDSALAAREDEFETMKLELGRREHRLVQAEKMTTVLDGARRDVTMANKIQQRDMHYNMGVVYAKEGNYREAEKEYLRALRIDPLDAGTHFNLGVLYDDELNNRRRAAMHYRKYLQLNPQGNDADTVRGWLMQMEMQ